MIIQRRYSGYAGGPEDWRNFLSCWKEEAERGRGESLIGRGDVVAIDRGDLSVSNDIDIKQNELGLLFPASYRHFLMAYRINNEVYRDGSAGFLPLNNVDPLWRVDGDLLEIYLSFPMESEDDEYYQYGIEQNDVSGRTSYLRNSIVIGKYLGDSFAYVLLNPQVKTEDGEMEAMMLFHSGAYRAPSFAELMRQIYYMEVGKVDHVPPYSQQVLAGTCADLIPAKGVWWK